MNVCFPVLRVTEQRHLFTLLVQVTQISPPTRSLVAQLWHFIMAELRPMVWGLSARTRVLWHFWHLTW